MLKLIICKIKSDVTFDLSELIEKTNNGDYSLITDLFTATKVAICEYHSNNGAQKFYKRFCIKPQSKITEQNTPFSNNNSLVEAIVIYHNTISNQTQKEQISFSEINNLHKKSQSNEEFFS